MWPHFGDTLIQTHIGSVVISTDSRCAIRPFILVCTLGDTKKPGLSEVGILKSALGIDKDLHRPQVTVQHTTAVKVTQTRCQLAKKTPHNWFRKAAILFEHIIQRTCTYKHTTVNSSMVKPL
jgi:hypothetical protein